MKYQWLATAAFGLEGVVRKELNDLGLSARAETRLALRSSISLFLCLSCFTA